MSESTPVVFQDFEVQRHEPTAFVAMQFGEPYDTIYRTVIRPEAKKLGIGVVRIDERESTRHHLPGYSEKDRRR